MIMSVEGLWTIQLSETEEFLENIEVSEQINRGGNFFLMDNKLYGAGLSYYFTGTYEAAETTITLELVAQRYNDIVPGMLADGTTLKLSGTVNEDVMTLHGTIAGDVNQMIFLQAKKRAGI